MGKNGMKIKIKLPSLFVLWILLQKLTLFLNDPLTFDIQEWEEFEKVRDEGKKKLEEEKKRVRREKLLLEKAQREMDVPKGKDMLDLVVLVTSPLMSSFIKYYEIEKRP